MTRENPPKSSGTVSAVEPVTQRFARERRISSAEHVTQRFEEPVRESREGLVTQRYQDEPGQSLQKAVTQRFESTETSAKPVGPGILSEGTLIGESYRVVRGPLGGVTGEAEVYACQDEHLDQPVAVKLYRYDANPKEAVITQLEGLSHPNVVRLLTHGRWMGRFFEVMEFCAGGVLGDKLPFSEDQIRQCLPALVQGLDFCHRQGIIHRDLKPNNLFFRDVEHREPLIGDFGISSYLDRKEGDVRVTQSAAHLTLDYAAPELLDGHEVSAKTDYYSLGITLLHLLTGHSPFVGMSNNDVLVAHLRGRLEVPAHLSTATQELVRGLTLGNPESRWGADEVLAWLQGEEVPLDLRGAVWSSVSRQGYPYPGYPQAHTPRELAAALDRFDAPKQLLRGDIRRWVFDHFDGTMADRIEYLEQNEAAKPEVAVRKLRFILDPKSPLEVGGPPLRTLSDLIGRLRQNDNHGERRALERDLWDEVLDAWIEAGQLAGRRTLELLTRMRELRVRLRGENRPSLAMDALCYLLEPTRGLQLTPEVRVYTLQDIGEVFERDPEHFRVPLQKLLFSKHLDEWLRAAGFPHWQKHIEFLEKLRLFYLENPLLGVYCLGWYCKPNMPFQFAGYRVGSPRQLATLIDQSPQNTQRGLAIMEQGWIRAWLVGTGKIANSMELDHALLAIDASAKSKLEAILHLLDPELASPQLAVEPQFLHLGVIVSGNTRTRRLLIRNRGRGYLYGGIRLAAYGAGLFLDHYRVEGNSVQIQVSIKTLGMEAGHYHNVLWVQTNGGKQEISVKFIVKAPEDTRPWWEKWIEKIYSS